MEDRKKAAAAVLALLLLEDEESENEELERKHWVQPCLAKREQLGAFHTIFQEIRNDPKRCRDYIRMQNEQFMYLVNLMKEGLQKQDTLLRDCIPPDELTCVALRFLAAGETFRTLMFQFKISRARISEAVIEVSEAIVKALNDYLNTPKSEAEWIQISRKFNQRWNFPNGIGAIDGKHIVMQQPGLSGSHYRNYKGSDSIVFLVMVGPEYELLYVDVGASGRNSDNGIWD